MDGTFVAVDQPVSSTCPLTVSPASMIHQWDQLMFLHWSYEPDVVQALLPEGLTIDTYDGQAWVGLVPFLMEVRSPRGPALPWISHFCETNVRTYVIAADGTRGVWFLSLDAARLAAVITARMTYRLPYFWSKMSFERTPDDTVTYSCTRRWPGPRGATSKVRGQILEPIAAGDLTEMEHFLTARWRLYSHTSNGIRYAHADHVPWPLRRVEVLDCDDELIAATGLPNPVGQPICHWSEGVEVRIGLPRKLKPLRVEEASHAPLSRRCGA